jgi:hypothetical protein
MSERMKKRKNERKSNIVNGKNSKQVVEKSKTRKETELNSKNVAKMKV